jgi:hypothetical protein
MAWGICKCLLFQGNVQGKVEVHCIAYIVHEDTCILTDGIPILPMQAMDGSSPVVKYKEEFKGHFYESLEGFGLAC